MYTANLACMLERVTRKEGVPLQMPACCTGEYAVHMHAEWWIVLDSDNVSS